MNRIRSVFSWWNELGLCLSLLFGIGYFGKLGHLGFLPTLLLGLFLIAGTGFILYIAFGKQNEDDYRESTNWDSLLWYFAIFLSGVAATTFLGALTTGV